MTQIRIDPRLEASRQDGLCMMSLLLVLIGSFATAITLAVAGSSLGMIALGYLLGGWVGFAFGVLGHLLASRKEAAPNLLSLPAAPMGSHA